MLHFCFIWTLDVTFSTDQISCFPSANGNGLLSRCGHLCPIPCRRDNNLHSTIHVSSDFHYIERDQTIPPPPPMDLYRRKHDLCPNPYRRDTNFSADFHYIERGQTSFHSSLGLDTCMTQDAPTVIKVYIGLYMNTYYTPVDKYFNVYHTVHRIIRIMYLHNVFA